MADNVLEDWEIEVTEFNGKYEDLKEETVVTPVKAKPKTKKQIMNEKINNLNLLLIKFEIES